MKRIVIGAVALSMAGVTAVVLLEPGSGATSPAEVERGRYLVKIGGCNDCHTPGYLTTAGKVPEDRWLVGDAIGYSGSWGRPMLPIFVACSLR